MTTETEEKHVTTDFLNMSDDEINNIDPSTFNQEAAPTDEVVENTQDVVDTADDEQAETEDAPAAVEKDSEEDAATDDPAGNEESNLKEKVADTSFEANEEIKVDYKAEYDRLVAPFKANGREITVKSVDDAIALMQMGANYNKKMSALKPNLKLMKLLENNGLLDETKIGFLIDLEKKNPDAINKLIKDSGLDPLDLDAEKAGEYKPSSYTVDDREMELDSVLDELQESPTYNQTLDIVSNKWDGPSKQVIANSPQLLRVVNSHVQSGIYDLISKEIESERTFGRLNGLSDIEAYRHVGDAIQAKGGFGHLSNQGQQVQPKPVIVQPKPKLVDNDKLREKKRAASSTKPTAGNQTPTDFNPLSLSDEAFSKLINDKYL